uniref:Uncharacterized protein n=1 Tax=viral metagenome TaxID=1070528 RepID=A0A6C0BC76_9ZZZZ
MPKDIFFIRYPSVSTFLSFIDDNKYILETKLSKVLKNFLDPNINFTQEITLDSNYYNVLLINTHAKKIGESLSKVLDDMYNQFEYRPKNVRKYIIENSSEMNVIGLFPSILNSIVLIGESKFNLILCQNQVLRTDIIPNLRNLCEYNSLLLVDKPFPSDIDPDFVKGWNFIEPSIDFEGFFGFHTFKSNKLSYTNEFKDSIRDSDITLSNFLDYNPSYDLSREYLEDYIREFIKHFVDREIVELELNPSNFNILVLCSNDKDIKNKRVVKFIKECMSSDVEIDNDAKIDYIGHDISINTNNIHRCNIENLVLNGSKCFDIIISDKCGKINLISNIKIIKNLLGPGCSLISQNITSLFDTTGFSIEYMNDGSHVILFKE